MLEALMRFKDYTTICSNAPGEFLARLALDQAQAISERNLTIIRRNLRSIHDFMAKRTDLFAWREPPAGPIAFARLRQGSATAFCQQLVLDCGVLLVPATVFDFGDSHLRFGLGRRNFPEGLAVLDEYLAGREV